MQIGILFRCRQKDQPEPFETKVLDAVLLESFPDVKFESATDLKGFLKLAESVSHHIVVFDWASCPAPTEVVEAYYQSGFCRSLMVIYHNGLRKTERCFLQEYSLRELAEVKDAKIKIAYADLLLLMKEVLVPTQSITKIRRAQIGIHFFLHNQKIDKAEELLVKVRKAMSVEELLFYDALILKAKGEFKKAIELLEKHPIASVKVNGLLGTLNYHSQNYQKSYAYFKNTYALSPMNLRRNVLFAKSIDRLSETNSAMRKEAMGVYLATYRLAPTYGGVTGIIVSLVTDTESVDNIPLMVVLLDQIPHRELIRIYKKIDKFSEPFQSAFKEVFVSAMSKIANRMIQEDDLTALTYYKYISKLIPDGDKVRKKALDYCLARAYFRFGQLEMAKELCDKVLKESGGTYEKAVALSVLIDKALRGEFDVLLDDEKDWLIQKKSA